MSEAQDRLRSAYRRIAERLGVHPSILPLQFERHDDGSRHFEEDGEGWKVVTTERGSDYGHAKLPDDNEALFVQTSDLTFSMACDYELSNRMDDRDCRELISARQIELMNQISPDWGDRVRKEWSATFRSFPIAATPTKELN